MDFDLHLTKKTFTLFLFFLAITTLSVTAAGAEELPVTETAVSVPTAATPPDTDWYTVGGNAARTSWVNGEVRGTLTPIWYKPFEAYIPPRVQIITTNGMLFVATANGLYALNAANGNECWVYPTEYPLGHSPTVVDGVAYVGGFDRKVHAINAQSCQNGGQRLWTFEAGAGFDTNPLVVNDMVYAGNRDGKFYAIYAAGANAGQTAWSFQTGGPIHYSAAYNNGVLYFASNDSYAYALNATTGSLVWKSDKLPGAGFQSWWPVIYQDKVIFSGSNNYRTSIYPGSINSRQFSGMESDEVFPNRDTDPRGTLVGARGTQPGNWAAGTMTVNASRIVNYFNQKPYRRSVIVLNQSNGAEPNKSAAPVLWTGTHSGTRYPPVVGVDGVLYQQNNYLSDPYINGGQISGWEPGSSYISLVNTDWAAVDEPHAASAGGNLVYWNLCCDRQAGAFDITIPRVEGNTNGSSREWLYFNYNLKNFIPNYNENYTAVHSNYLKPYTNFGNINGVYGFHADTNPPIPYNGRVYMHRSNAIIAFEDRWPPSSTKLPTAQIVNAPDESLTPLGVQGLTSSLETEVQKIIDAGHLQPGYISHGIFDFRGSVACGDDLVDYWHSSADTLYTLAMAYPYLSPGLQNSVKTYMANEYTNYPPYLYNHVGWDTGAARGAFDVPPDIATQLANSAPRQANWTFRNSGGWNGQGGWQRNPFTFYALWQYAELVGNAAAVRNDAQSAFWNEFNNQPPDSLLLNMPLAHNAYIAGYLGWLELEAAAGQPESTNVRNELNRLLALRANNFTKNTAYTSAGESGDQPYCRSLNISSNFLYMAPELADYLKANALNKVQTAVNEYETVAPYWYVTLFEAGYAENAQAPLFDAYGLFAAKSWILDVPGEEMEKLLDVPAFPVGDLYYVQKLVMALENQAYGFGLSLVWPTSGSRTIDAGKVASFNFRFTPSGGFVAPITMSAVNLPPNFTATFPDSPVSPPGTGRVWLRDSSPDDAPPARYTVTIRASGDGITADYTVDVLVNPAEVYLPVIVTQ